MKQKGVVWIALGFLALLLGAAGATTASLAPGAQAANTAAQGQQVGTAFTYQGRLEDGSGPASGVYDLRFELYNDPDAGALLGTVTVEDHPISEGLFTVQLDFGDLFDGEARWLEVAVRPGGDTGGYTPLSPRQALAPAPFALYASGAPWGGIQDVPADLADGDDDTTYTAGVGLALSGVQFSAQGSPYANVLVVAQSGGDFSSVQAALDSITDAAADNPYLVYVAPGVYEQQVTLKPYVTLEGAGEEATILRWTGGNAYSAASATLAGADNASIRHVTVESDGAGQEYAIAIYNDNASPTMSNVTATASGASTGLAIRNASSSPTMTNMEVTASGSTDSYGVYNASSSSPAMTNVTIMASGGRFNHGVFNRSSSPVMTNVTAIALGGSTSIGVNSGDTLTGGPSAPRIRRSLFEGGTYSVYQHGSDVEVANSQLIGPLSSNLTCFSNYDENLDPINCP